MGRFILVYEKQCPTCKGELVIATEDNLYTQPCPHCACLGVVREEVGLDVFVGALCAAEKDSPSNVSGFKPGLVSGGGQ